MYISQTHCPHLVPVQSGVTTLYNVHIVFPFLSVYTETVLLISVATPGRYNTDNDVSLSRMIPPVFGSSFFVAGFFVECISQSTPRFNSADHDVMRDTSFTCNTRLLLCCYPIMDEWWSRGRAPDCQSRGRWFNPTYRRFET